jgi:hypothetical protein
MPGNIQNLIKLLKTNGLCSNYVQCGGKIKLNQFASSLQGLRFEIFNPINYLIFEILNKTQSTQRIDFSVFEIGDEPLKKSKNYINRVEKAKDLEYNLQSLHIATNLHFTQQQNKLFYKTETI